MNNSDIYVGIVDALQHRVNIKDIGVTEARDIAEYAYQVYILESIDEEYIDEPFFPDFTYMDKEEFTESVYDFLNEFVGVSRDLVPDFTLESLLSEMSDLADIYLEAEYAAKTADQYAKMGKKLDQSGRRDINNEKDRRKAISRAYKADYAKYEKDEKERKNKEASKYADVISNAVEKDTNERIQRKTQGHENRLTNLRKKSANADAMIDDANQSLKTGGGVSRFVRTVNPYSKENKQKNDAKNYKDYIAVQMRDVEDNKNMKIQQLADNGQRKYNMIMQRIANGKSLRSNSEEDNKVYTKYGKTKSEFKQDAKDEKAVEKLANKNIKIAENNARAAAKAQQKAKDKQMKRDMKMAKKHGNVYNNNNTVQNNRLDFNDEDYKNYKKNKVVPKKRTIVDKAKNAVYQFFN